MTLSINDQDSSIQAVEHWQVRKIDGNGDLVVFTWTKYVIADLRLGIPSLGFAIVFLGESYGTFSRPQRWRTYLLRSGAPVERRSNCGRHRLYTTRSGTPMVWITRFETCLAFYGQHESFL